MRPVPLIHEPEYASRLLSLAGHLQATAENTPRADKTWVLRRLREWTRLYLEARHALEPTPSVLPEPFREDIVDPFVEACHALQTAGIGLLVVGSFGIALRGRERGLLVVTEDFDILLRRDVPELARALALLRRHGFGLSAGGEPLIDEDPVVLAGIVRARSPVRAIRRGWTLDLLTHAAALDFEEASARQTPVLLQGVEIPVASLEDLIASKRAADRPKDRIFLEKWREQLEDPEG